MKIVKEYPPNIKYIEKAFKLHYGIIFAYGDTLYNPDDGKINKPLLEHEKVHSKQQGDNPDKWWGRYLVDIDFRASQEIEAYQRQYRVGKNEIKDREKLNLFAMGLARDLSSEMYGNIMNFNEALQVIKSNKNFKFKINV